jgi:hypothetical protein
MKFVPTNTLISSRYKALSRFLSGRAGATVLREGEPTFLRLGNIWLTINGGGGGTDDKPDVVAAPPRDPNALSNFINRRVSGSSDLIDAASSSAITRSAPVSFLASVPLLSHTGDTTQPLSLALKTAERPTLPAAPVTRRIPVCRLRVASSAHCAPVIATCGTAADSMTSIRSGILARPSAFTKHREA